MSLTNRLAAPAFTPCLTENSGSLIFVNLLTVEMIFKGPIAGFLNIFSESLTAYLRLMLGNIFLDSYVKKPRNIN